MALTWKKKYTTGINTNICSDYINKHILNPLKPTQQKKKVMLTRGIEAHNRYAGRISQKNPKRGKKEEEK